MKKAATATGFPPRLDSGALHERDTRRLPLGSSLCLLWRPVLTRTAGALLEYMACAAGGRRSDARR
jgi:hypothetical protein